MTTDETTGFKWGVAVVACIAVFIIDFDGAALGVAITTLVVEFDTDITSIQAMITLYTLMTASFLLFGSKI